MPAVLKVADLACGCSLLIQNYTFTDTIWAVCSFLFFFSKEKTNICLNISREVCQRCKIKSRQQSLFIYRSVFVILVSDYGLPHLHFFIPFSFIHLQKYCSFAWFLEEECNKMIVFLRHVTSHLTVQPSSCCSSASWALLNANNPPLKGCSCVYIIQIEKKIWEEQLLLCAFSLL